ncbi:MAG: hypothetical protein AABM30_05945 [Actinomycetota bacterium]
MEPSEPYPPERQPPPAPVGRERDMLLTLPGGIWAAGERVSALAGFVLMLSVFMGWYAGSEEGPTIAVIGWHTGAIGKLVFLLGLAVVVLVVLREFGIELPATVPESLVIIVIGSLATILVLIRLISVPDRFFPNDGRGIGIWIALIAALALIVGGLLRAGEEL